MLKTTDGNSRMNQTKVAMHSIINQMKAETGITKFNIFGFSQRISKFRDQFVSVRSDELRQANNFVDYLKPKGTTKMNVALKESLKQFSTNNSNKPKVLFFLSDGQPTHANGAPMKWSKVHNDFIKSNMDPEAIVFAFAIGAASPFDELEKLSLRSRGAARKISDSTDISIKLSNFYREIATPIIWNHQCKYKNSKNAICSDSKLFKEKVQNT